MKIHNSVQLLKSEIFHLEHSFIQYLIPSIYEQVIH